MRMAMGRAKTRPPSVDGKEYQYVHTVPCRGGVCAGCYGFLRVGAFVFLVGRVGMGTEHARPETSNIVQPI